MDVGKRIREIRTSRKLTAKELSERCGVPEKSIYKIESGGVKDPRISSVMSIAKGLGCSVDELISDIDIDVVTTQMIDLIKRSRTLNGVTRDYIVHVLENYMHNESIQEVLDNSMGIDKDIAEDIVIKRRLELKRERTTEDNLLLRNLQETYGAA